MSDSELIIDENNFEQYFFDVRRHKPQKGQIMVKYTAIAEFVDGLMKKNIIDLLHKNKAEAAVSVMRNLGCATEKESIRIVREVCDDLVYGMTKEDVEKKIYKYTLESFYYTQKENFPLNDPHWVLINVKNMDEFLDASNKKCKITAKIVDSIDDKEKIE
jgi:hypothetical protein